MYFGKVKPTETTSSVLRSTYTGNGSTTTYALPGPVANETSIIATINGVTQQDGAYSTDGSNIIFDAAPALNDAIELRTISAVGLSYAPYAGSVTTGILADDAVTTGKIVAGSVTSAKLASGAAVANIGARAITTAQVPVGSVIQVVQIYSDITFNTSSSSDVATGVLVSITPTSASSKMLIMMTGVCGSAFTTNFGRGRMQRSIAGGNYSGIGNEFFLGGNFATTNGNRTTEEWSHDFLDSPNTTSSITYQLFMAVYDGNSMWLGRWGQDVNWRQATTITVMEIAG